jgi:trigger factor
MNMTVSVEKTNGLGRKLTVIIPRTEIQSKVNNRLNELRTSAAPKGFRQGKMSQELVAQRYGKAVTQEVTQELIQTSFGKALEQEKLRPAGRPAFNEIDNKDNADLSYHVEFEVLPDVKIEPFSSFKVDKKVVEITSADLDKMVAKLKKQLADWEAVDRAAASGDRLKVDFVRTVSQANQETPDVEEENNAYVVIGQEGNIQEIDAALIGKTVSDQPLVLTVTYPKDWHEHKVAGQPAELKITIKGIQESKALNDDEFVEKLGLKEGTLDEALEKLQAEMKKQCDTIIHNEIKEQITEQLTKLHNFELPKILIDQEIEQLQEEDKHRGHVHTDACAHTHEAEYETEANRRVTLGLVANTIIQENDLKADPMKIRQEIEKIAMMYGGSPEIVKAYYNNRQLLGAIEQMVLLDAIVDLIAKDATTQEVSTTFDELTSSR